jgi:thymidylate synthase
VCFDGALRSCKVCGLAPGEFVHTIGDAHVYLNHRAALKQQLARAPKPFPTLTIKPRPGGRAAATTPL